MLISRCRCGLSQAAEQAPHTDRLVNWTIDTGSNETETGIGLATELELDWQTNDSDMLMVRVWKESIW